MSSLLLNCLPYVYSDIRSLDQSITSLVIPKLGCNDLNNTFMCFSRFTQIESIEIGDDCFGSVQTFQIDGLNRLKIIKIGNNSFTHVKGSDWDNNNNNVNSRANDKSKSFHILNCESLESIDIGEYSFSDFAGEFELKNLPKLQSIQIGTKGKDSYNFYYSSFVIRGIDVILNILMIRSSKSTIHYIR